MPVRAGGGADSCVIMMATATLMIVVMTELIDIHGAPDSDDDCDGDTDVKHRDCEVSSCDCNVGFS